MISHTGQLQEPAGHWQEEPQLHPWSPIALVSNSIEKGEVKSDGRMFSVPRYDPAIPKSDQARERIFRAASS